MPSTLFLLSWTYSNLAAAFRQDSRLEAVVTKYA